MPTNIPDHLTIRTYQVGFGDCFLLTFHYTQPKRERHVLIDFGSTGSPKRHGPHLLDRVASQICADCNNKLDIVVATHRHRDHINGFATSDGGQGPGNIIRKCKPEVVLQPWTEDPDATPDARTPMHRLPATQAYLKGLTAMQDFSASLLKEVDLLGSAISSRTRAQLSFLGEDNLANASAVKNLMRMGRRKPKYLYFGADPDLSSILPGVTIHVLGPPTLKQSNDITQQRAKDQAEFWHFQAATSKNYVNRGTAAFRGPVSRTRRPYTRWMIPRLQASRGEQLLELVRMLDDALNNTSLILLFVVKGKKFLFPGDAQIENWSYALAQAEKRPKLKKALQDIDFYKVGHHGSLNATPKSLWNLFAKRSTKKGPSRLQTIVSTMSGKHGHKDRGTEVPREKLIDALKRETNLFSTQELKKKSDLKREFKIPL